MIKAIETIYKGYRFRSRLEARWAVFFDAIGVMWDYEPEGFEFSDGTCYLPDFYIHDWNLWVEVKKPDGLDSDAEKKLENFRDENSSIMVVYGLPGEYFGYLLAYDLKDDSCGTCECNDIIMCRFKHDGKVHLLSPNAGFRDFYNNNMYEKKIDVFSSKTDLKELFKGIWRGVSPLYNEYLAAKQARFEHGEHGGYYEQRNHPR